MRERKIFRRVVHFKNIYFEVGRTVQKIGKTGISVDIQHEISYISS